MRDYAAAVDDFLQISRLHPQGGLVTDWLGAAVGVPSTGSAAATEVLASVPEGCIAAESDKRMLVMVRCAQGVDPAVLSSAERSALLWPLLKVETGYLLVAGFADGPSGDPNALLDPAWVQRPELTAAGWWPAGFPGEGAVRSVHLDTSARSTDLWLGWALPRDLAAAQTALFGRAAFAALPLLTGHMMA